MLNMKKSLPLIGISIFAALLSGCSTVQVTNVPPQEQYDIDTTCNNSAGNAFVICDPLQKDECDEETIIYSCYYGNFFHIKCDKKTTQVIDETYTCLTHDEKSVRIMVTRDLPTDEDFNEMFKDND